MRMSPGVEYQISLFILVVTTSFSLFAITDSQQRQDQNAQNCDDPDKGDDLALDQDHPNNSVSQEISSAYDE